MVDLSRLITILVQGAAFTAAVAAIVAAFLMYEITKKFGSGILASGFRTISYGVAFLAIAIIIDAFSSYFLSVGNVYSQLTSFIEALFFVAATYTIVVGTKKTADRLEKLTK